VDYYVYAKDSALAWRLFHVTPDMIDVYSRLTGIPYPWQKYAQTTVADFFGGMENVSATTLVDWLPDARAYQDRPWYQHILIPHELAHQWFGDYVTTENWANTWLNEGFAEFMPGQYWAQKLGARAGQDYYADEYHQFMNIEGRRPMPLTAISRITPTASRRATICGRRSSTRPARTSTGSGASGFTARGIRRSPSRRTSTRRRIASPSSPDRRSATRSRLTAAACASSSPRRSRCR
jgi:hypothetical protein